MVVEDDLALNDDGWNRETVVGARTTYKALEFARDEGDRAGDPVLRGVGSHRHHCEATVLQLIEKILVFHFLGLALGESERVIAKFTGSSVTLSEPEFGWIGNTFNQSDRQQDLTCLQHTNIG